MHIVVTHLRSRRHVIAAAGVFALFLGLTYSFLVNGFGVASWNEWSNWQRESEAEVLLRVEADSLGRDVSLLGNLLNASGDGLDTGVYDRLADPAFPANQASQEVEFRAYESMIGGWAHAVSLIWRYTPITGISRLHALSSALMSVMVIAMFWGFRRIGATGFAWAWLASMAFSPWIAYVARNLYWASWMWFLPSLAAVFLVLSRTKLKRGLALTSVFVAFLAKYMATGFEAFTTFTIIAVSVPLLALLFNDASAQERKRQRWNALGVFVVSGLAFITTILVQARLLAGSLVPGLQLIWTNTILRRTYGVTDSLDPAYMDSMSASFARVIWKYAWEDWDTNLLSFSLDKHGSVLAVSVGPWAFLALATASILIVLVGLAKKYGQWKRDAALLTLGFASAVSWLFAAKGHSYIHTFVLFFLWYLLALPAVIYVVVWNVYFVIAGKHSGIADDAPLSDRKGSCGMLGRIKRSSILERPND